MCKFKSGLIFKNRVVLAPEENESHSDLLRSMNIDDTRENAMRMFIRAELFPIDGNKFSDVDKWKFNVDQDITPEWYDADPDRYENEFRDAVKEYMEEYKRKYNFVGIVGKLWNPIKRDGNRIYYLLVDSLFECQFGENNNYAESYVEEKINNSDLTAELKNTYGDKLVPITTDLLSLDGLDDYGKVTGDILAIPTIDLYRECRKKIPKLNKWWWLATPNSTPSGYGSDRVRCVDGGGGVGFSWCDDVGSVRPFFIVEEDSNETK